MRRFRGLDTDSHRWYDFPFRDTDIVISSPMKAGTTWTQMICALLVFRTPDLPAPLGELSPWLDMQTRPLDDVVADLEAQSHRRFIKTHTPVDCLPIPPSVTVVGVGRHPLDLYASAARHSANIDARRTIELVAAVIGDDATNELLADRPRRTADPGERLRFFLEEDHPAEVALTLAGVMDHYRSFLAEDVHIVRVHYADLMDDREREMRRLAADLGIDVADDEWPDLVAAADFATMKARAAQLVPDAGAGMVADPDAFFARAAVGEWRESVTKECRDRFGERLAELDPDGEIARWAQHGLYSSE